MLQFVKLSIGLHCSSSAQYFFFGKLLLNICFLHMMPWLVFYLWNCVYLICCAYCLLGLASRKYIQGNHIMIDSQTKQLPKQVFFIYLLAHLPFMPPVWSIKAWLFLIFRLLSCLNLGQLPAFWVLKCCFALHWEGIKSFLCEFWLPHEWIF